MIHLSFKSLLQPTVSVGVGIHFPQSLSHQLLPLLSLGSWSLPLCSVLFQDAGRVLSHLSAQRPLPSWGRSRSLDINNLIYLCLLFSRWVASDSVTPWTVARQASLPRDFSGKNTGVGCSFHQGIFPSFYYTFFIHFKYSALSEKISYMHLFTCLLSPLAVNKTLQSDILRWFPLWEKCLPHSELLASVCSKSGKWAYPSTCKRAHLYKPVYRRGTRN